MPTRGSPAHAGMAPCSTRPCLTTKRFPRPRGDGPWRAGDPIALHWVPPPTRGWPPERGLPERGRPEVPPPTRGWPLVGLAAYGLRVGSPAHAGMAPCAASSARPAQWFPRPRGDGPLSRAYLSGADLVPPPTRGWPLKTGPMGHFQRGSPAHAGMAPRNTSWPSLPVRFPRPRGDGPYDDISLAGIQTVPPPTRGWPLCKHVGARSIGGSPAHAGMAPNATPNDLDYEGFPRPRGDGPCIVALNMATRLVPPPTRGWPRDDEIAAAVFRGSPAHAGMAPRAT